MPCCVMNCARQLHRQRILAADISSQLPGQQQKKGETTQQLLTAPQPPTG